MRKILAVMVVGLLAGTLLSLFAEAGHRVVRDPDDSRSRLDVRRIDVGGTRWRPRWTISTWRTWKIRQIWDSGFFVIKIDTFADRRHDYFVLVRSTGDDMRANLFRDRRTKPDYFIARLPAVWRPTRRSVAAIVPLRKTYIPKKRKFVRWAVWTMDNDRCRRVCLDRAPDAGWIRERIRDEASPTPTTTSSPLPTPLPD